MRLHLRGLWVFSARNPFRTQKRILISTIVFFSGSKQAVIEVWMLILVQRENVENPVLHMINILNYCAI